RTSSDAPAGCGKTPASSPMNDVQAKIDKLLDSRFVTNLLALQSDEGCLAGLATGFYLAVSDLETLRPLLNPAHHAPPILLRRFNSEIVSLLIVRKRARSIQ